MNSTISLDSLKSICGGCRLYSAVIDGSRNPDIYPKLKQLPQRVSCLHSGISNVAEENRGLYPYQVELRDDEFSQWLFSEGWGNRWCIFIGTDVSFPLLRNYFANQLLSSQKNSHADFFKFYDPQVLQQFLFNAGDAQLKKMFKYVTYYWMEKENNRPIYFYFKPRASIRKNPKDVYIPDFVRHLPLASEL